jgi:hypothetical protein
MDHLLNNISWSTYLATASLIALTYYGYVAWTYYRNDIQRAINKVSGKIDDNSELPAALRYEEEPLPEIDPLQQNNSYQQEQHDQVATENEGIAYELGQELSACIEAHADKAFNPAILIPKIKDILNDYPDLAATPDREQINVLIVRECERTGTALLTENEVDTWWSA